MGTWLTNANKFIKNVPVYSSVSAGVNINSVVMAVVRAVNTAGIITIIIPDLYTLITASKRDLFRIIRILLLGFVIEM